MTSDKRFLFVKNSDPRGPKGLVIQCQITLEVSMGQEKESLLKIYGSRDQGLLPCIYMVKALENSFTLEPMGQ